MITPREVSPWQLQDCANNNIILLYFVWVEQRIVSVLY